MRGMPNTNLDIRYRDRRAARIENSAVRVTVLREGGHIAEIFDKVASVNPLWTPHWASIEPSAYDRNSHVQFGSGSDARLLAGIMGHNLCLDVFGGPSDEEAAAGVSAHGDGSVALYEVDTSEGALVTRAHLPAAQLLLERRIELRDRTVAIRETVENLAAFDRPIAWTQHVTLGPPFLQKGVTEFRVSATRSKVFEDEFGADDYLQPATEFGWPLAPLAGGGHVDLRRFTAAKASTAYTAHLMDPAAPSAFFVAFCPAADLALGYVWRRSDFPWLGIWEENFSRTHTPWSGRALTRGMEFGVSPFPESRRRMVERGRMFDTPTFRWLPARTTIEVEYCALTRTVNAIPESLEWPL
jgi:hypothetical protein